MDLHKSAAAFIIGVSLMLTACGASGSSSSGTQASAEGLYEYLGDYDYESSLAALVYEPVSGESEYGIQWRSVKDLNGIINSGNNVLLYFYNSLSTDRYGITAGVEDIAQASWGNLIVVMIDTLGNEDYTVRYDIRNVPEFVLIKEQNEAARFEGYNYDVWTMSDVAKWVQANGINVDYSKLG